MHQEGDDEVRHLKSELAQLRVDLKAMQEKTNILQEENVTLRQNIRDIKASSRLVSDSYRKWCLDSLCLIASMLDSLRVEQDRWVLATPTEVI